MPSTTALSSLSVLLLAGLLAAPGAGRAHVVFQRICVSEAVEATTPGDRAYTSKGAALKAAWAAWSDYAVAGFGDDFRQWHHAEEAAVSCDRLPSTSGGFDHVCTVRAIPCKTWTED